MHLSRCPAFQRPRDALSLWRRLEILSATVPATTSLWSDLGRREGLPTHRSNPQMLVASPCEGKKRIFRNNNKRYIFKRWLLMSNKYLRGTRIFTVLNFPPANMSQKHLNIPSSPKASKISISIKYGYFNSSFNCLVHPGKLRWNTKMEV